MRRCEEIELRYRIDYAGWLSSSNGHQQGTIVKRDCDDASESKSMAFGTDVPEDELDRAATHIDGAYSIMTGICANKSIASGLPVNVKDIITITDKGYIALRKLCSREIFQGSE